MEILNGIAFNSQPKAYRPSKMSMNPVRLRLTVKRDQTYNLIGIEENATAQCSLAFLSPKISAGATEILIRKLRNRD